MKNIFLITFLLSAFIAGAQSIDGKKNTRLPEKTTIDANDIIVVGDDPTGKWHKAKYSSLVTTLATSQNLTESTYTPTAAGVTNVNAATPTVAYYQRLGYTVNVWGEVTINPGESQSAAELTLTLPIASAVAQTYEISGIAQNNDSTTIRVLGNVAGDKASLKWVAMDTTSKAFSYRFTYHIN